MVARAFVIGTAAWDETLHLAALPAPGASVHVRRGVAGPGGKGANQAVVLARTGVPVTLVATIGHDARGEALAATLTAEGLGGGLVRRDVATCSRVGRSSAVINASDARSEARAFPG